MPDFVKTQQLQAVPKTDVDRMFEQMYKLIKAGSPFAQELRGIVYANSFMATKRTIIVGISNGEELAQIANDKA